MFKVEYINYAYYTSGYVEQPQLSSDDSLYLMQFRTIRNNYDALPKNSDAIPDNFDAIPKNSDAIPGNNCDAISDNKRSTYFRA